ncbi:16908_t:CDS:2, partial [Gigaspora margarita]
MNGKKQSWDEMVDNNTEKLKDITNVMPPLADANTIEMHTESLDMKKDDALTHNEKNVQTGPGGLMDNNFFENIDDFLGLSEQKATTLGTVQKGRKNEKLQPEPDGNKGSIADMQANMFSHVSNIEQDEFKVVTYKKPKSKRRGTEGTERQEVGTRMGHV